MVIVQRVMVRWTKRGRGAGEAARRREIPSALELPPMPDGPLLLHDVLAEDRTGYATTSASSAHALPGRLNGLRFEEAPPSGLRVVRSPVWAAYPATRHPGQVFLLRPGERARYRANFRFSGAGIEWYYEEWTVNIACAPWRRDLFLTEEFDHEKDERVSLYGGPRR